MGMLIEGTWVEHDETVKLGAYQRADSCIRTKGISPLANRISESPDDFWLIGSHSCPWSHRTLLVRAIKQKFLPTHYAFGPRVAGYALNGGEPWEVPGSTFFAKHLHELYTIHDSSYSGRVTVPILWDAVRQQIVSNESADILAVLDEAETRDHFDFTLRPCSLLTEIKSKRQRNPL